MSGRALRYPTQPTRGGCRSIRLRSGQALHDSGASQFGFERFRAVRRSDLPFEMAIKAIALDWVTAGFADDVLKGGHGLFLRRGRPGHVENLFFHDRAM